MDLTLTPPRIWKAEQVRFTAFPTGPIDLAGATDWWTNLIGRPPESLTMQQGAVLQAVGSFDKGNLSLVAMTAGEVRVDFLLSPQSLIASQSPSEFASIGDPDQATLSVQHVFEKWMDLGIPVRRIGVSGVVFSDVGTRSEGYTSLAALLPAVKIDSDNSSDFGYQINRPRVSQVAGIQVNRLSRWSVASRQPVMITFGPQGIGVVPSLNAAQPSNFNVRTEYDVNTSAQNLTSISETLIKRLVEELVSFAKELRISGDIP